MSGGCPRVGNLSDQNWGISVIAVIRVSCHNATLAQETHPIALLRAPMSRTS